MIALVRPWNGYRSLDAQARCRTFHIAMAAHSSERRRDCAVDVLLLLLGIVFCRNAAQPLQQAASAALVRVAVATTKHGPGTREQSGKGKCDTSNPHVHVLEIPPSSPLYLS